MTAAPPDPTDESLALRAAARDAAHIADANIAFGLLMERYSHRLVRYLNSLGLSHADADDVASEVWLAVWRGLPGWTPGHFRGWLFTIARNQRINHLRPQQRRRTVSLEGLGEMVGRAPTAEQEALEKELAEILAHCRDNLTDEHRTVLEAHYAGVTYEELAKKLGISIGTVKSRIFRARAALMECAGQNPPDEPEAEGS